jgi:hypothetical protein
MQAFSGVDIQKVDVVRQLLLQISHTQQQHSCTDACGLRAKVHLRSYAK